MSTRHASDPALSLRFEVKVDGIDIGTFTGCDGLQAEYEIFEYAEGGNNSFVHRLPGRLKYTNVKLSRAVDRDSAKLARWFASLRYSVSKKTGSITAYDGNKARIAQWNLVDVWPVRYTGPTLASDGTTAAKETLELAHNGFFPG